MVVVVVVVVVVVIVSAVVVVVVVDVVVVFLVFVVAVVVVAAAVLRNPGEGAVAAAALVQAGPVLAQIAAVDAIAAPGGTPAVVARLAILPALDPAAVLLGYPAIPAARRAKRPPQA
jgi:hypothetical protein